MSAARSDVNIDAFSAPRAAIRTITEKTEKTASSIKRYTTKHYLGTAAVIALLIGAGVGIHWWRAHKDKVTVPAASAPAVAPVIGAPPAGPVMPSYPAAAPVAVVAPVMMMPSAAAHSARVDGYEYASMGDEKSGAFSDVASAWDNAASRSHRQGDSQGHGHVIVDASPAPHGDYHATHPKANVDGSVTILTEEDLKSFLAVHKDAVVAFSQKWCGHCKTLKVPFDCAARRSAVPFVYVDAAAFSPASLKPYALQGFPHIVRVTNGKSKVFSGAREESSFMSFAA